MPVKIKAHLIVRVLNETILVGEGASKGHLNHNE